jgi:putative peptidoglycan lipid II flippase
MAERDEPGFPPSRRPGPALVQGILERWRRLTSGSVNRKVFGAAMVVGVMTLGTKFFSLLKESVVAGTYGTGDAFDAFIVALLLPTTIAAILSASLNAALIPTYIEVRENEDLAAAQRLYTTVLLWNTILLVVFSVAMAATARLWLPLLASGFGPAKLELARKLLFWSMPVILITGYSATWGALLNAGERFALVAIAPALQPLAIIAGLLLLGRHLGIYALLAGTVLGMALEAAILGLVLHRKGHSLLPRWWGATPAFRKVRAQYGATIASAFLVSGMGLVDQGFASALGPRSNSALNYGSKLVSLVLSLGATALATAILPQLSRMVAQREWNGIRRFLRVFSGLILAVTVPASLLLIVLSPLIIRVMFQHGAFTATDTELVVRIQVFYLLRVPFSTVLVLVTRTLTALRANQVLLYMSIGTFTLNGLLDWLFIRRFGIAGITLSTSACSVVVLGCLTLSMLHMLAKREREAQA